MYKDFEKKTLEDALKKGQLTAATVFDCISVRTIEITGYDAAILSGRAVSYNMNGVPDMGLLNIEEVIWLTTRMTNYTPLPVIVDAGAISGDNPSKVYLDSFRLVKAGADAIVISDETIDGGFDRQFQEGYKEKYVSDEVYWERIKAAVKAAEGSKCCIIAKSIAPVDEAVTRNLKAKELGAVICWVEKAKTIEEARLVNSKISGYKMWSQIAVENNKCVVTCEELKAENVAIVTEDYAIKAAMFGMLYYGKKTLEDGNTVFHDTHTYDGLLKPGEDYHVLFSFWKLWLPMEDEFNDLSDIMAINHEIN